MNDFYKKVLSSVLTQGAGLLLGFVSSVLLAQMLGAEGRGAVSWIMALHVLGAAIAQVGMPQVNRRFAASHPDTVHHLVFLTVFVCLVASCVMVPVLSAIALNNTIGDANWLAFLLAMFALPLLAIADTLGSLQVGLGHARAFNLANFSQKFLGVGAIAAFAALGLLTPLVAVAALVSGVGVKLVIALYSVQNHLTYDRAGISQMYHEIKRYMRFSSLGQIAGLFASHGIVLTLGIFATAEDVGYYAGVYVLVEAMCILPKITGMYLVPRIVALADNKKRRHESIKILAVVMAIMGVGVLLAAELADWGIPFLFGEDFRDAVPVFYWLLVGALSYSLYTILQNILLAVCEKRVISYPPICSAVVVLLCSAILFPQYGAVGGAMAWLASNSISAILAFILLYTTSKKRTTE